MLPIYIIIIIIYYYLRSWGRPLGGIRPLDVDAEVAEDGKGFVDPVQIGNA